jgi:hypothetical protein
MLLGDDPLVSGRPLDPERGVVPSHAASGLRCVVVRHAVVDLGFVREGLLALCDPFRDVRQPLVLRAQLGAEPSASVGEPGRMPFRALRTARPIGRARRVLAHRGT